jgi:hypothetical protein
MAHMVRPDEPRAAQDQDLLWRTVQDERPRIQQRSSAKSGETGAEKFATTLHEKSAVEGDLSTLAPGPARASRPRLPPAGA